MRISVITTTYNRKDYLLETIKSVQDSILKPLEGVEFEHIIFDNGSTDGTDSLFKNQKFSNTKYIKENDNHGPSYGRNKAIAQMSGDYILPLDSDDIILQRTLYNFAKVAKEMPETAWFTSDFLRVDAEGRYIASQDYYGWDFNDPKMMLQSIFAGDHFIQGNVFFKKSLFDLVGGYDESMRMAEDLDIYIRFLLRGHLPKHQDFISHLHRLHNNNLSNGMTAEKHKIDVDTLKLKYL